jgi:hypothetical protein
MMAQAERLFWRILRAKDETLDSDLVVFGGNVTIERRNGCRRASFSGGTIHAGWPY